MEKHTPHCKLSVAQALVAQGKVRTTHAARQGATMLDLSLQGVLDVVMRLTRRDFYKSMTTHADHRIWQDVYHGQTTDGQAVYLKLTVAEDVLIVSFKEL